MSTRFTAQAKPTAGVEASLRVAAGNEQGSSLVCCNMGTSVAKIRVRYAVAGVAADDKQYLVYDLEVDPAKNSPYVLTIGITLAITDVVYVYSDNGNVAFNLFLAIGL